MSFFWFSNYEVNGVSPFKAAIADTWAKLPPVIKDELIYIGGIN